MRQRFQSSFKASIYTILQSEVKYYSFNVNTSTGLGEYYEFLIFLSGNICTQPDNVGIDNTSLAVYYSFNSTMFQNNEVGQMQLFEDGYFQALADLPIDPNTSTTEGTSLATSGAAASATTIPSSSKSSSGDDEERVLYIAVRAPENTNLTATWTYQIGVSQNDLVFQWDNRTFGSIIDADDRSALLVTENLTEFGGDWRTLNASKSQYSLYVYPYKDKDIFEGLSKSWCAIRSGHAMMGPWNIETSFTSRNGGIQQQFYVPNLEESTQYTGYIVADFSGTSFGGAIYHQIEFETMAGSACELIYDLEFCDRVAYSVPALGNRTDESDAVKNMTKMVYDNYVKSLYQNFSKALQQVACDTNPESVYSNVKTCDDCADSYKDWLCAVSIPRCAATNFPGYKARNGTNQRNDFISDMIQPAEDYFEILPCANVCHAIVRDCPADFQFQCPINNQSIALSYYWDEDTSTQWPSCNYVGKMFTKNSWGLKLGANWALLSVVLFMQVI
ncbi:MID1 [Candida theae]|uniref:MID1 n=1 Tax=Candida theae TaxID=1198502 RepID=A0AAD5BFX1_9ASCO|nr:MID1 [Candida theae]KAI5960012.1 MID1 [Candida theae]